MNFYALPSLISSLFCLVWGILIFGRNPKARINRIFSLLCLVFALWTFSEFVYRSTEVESVALIWTRIEGVAWSLFPAFLLHFFIVFAQKEKFFKNFWSYLFLYLPSVIFAVLALISDFLVLPKVELRYWGYQEFVGSWFILFVIYYLVYSLIGLFLCFQVTKTKEKNLKRRAQIIFVFYLLALIGGTITDAIFPFLKIETFISVTHFLFISLAGVAFAIVKYGEMVRPVYRSLVFKFIFLVVIIFLLFLAPLSFWLYKKVSSEVRESLRRELKTLALTASKLIDVRTHEAIRSPEDEDTPLYERARAKIKELAKWDSRINSIWTARATEKENIVAFVLDTWDTEDRDGDGIIETEEERAHVNEEYDISRMSEFQKGFEEVSADYEINCDKWGCWLSGYAPIVNESGETVALIGVDISALDIKKIEREMKRVPLIFIFGIITPFALISLVVFWQFIRPIKHLEIDMKKFAGDLRHRSRLKTFDEFDSLVSQFNKMAERISGIHKELEEKVWERTKELQEANQNLSLTYKKLKESDEMRKEFVSHTAHELRTPLNIFRWSIELLQSGDLGKINLKQKEVLEQVYQSNLRLINLVNDLLEVARIDETRLKIILAPCQIEEVIDEVICNLSSKIKEKQFRFFWRKPKPALPKVKADKSKIFEVVLNLLDNAVKFTPKGGKIEIKASLTNQMASEEILRRYGFVQKDKEYILVSISDAGIGIPKAEQERMFSRFFRGSNVQKAQIPGTGLGMTIAFEIIKMHNGAIWFESEEDKGTIFYFTLPVV